MYSVNPLDYSFGHIDSFYWDISWRPFGATNEKRTQTISSELSLRVFCCVMIAASVWSLLLPSIEMSEQFGRFAWLPAAVGFLFGVFFLLFWTM